MKKLPIKKSIEFAARTMWNYIGSILLGSVSYLIALILGLISVVFVSGGIISGLYYVAFRSMGSSMLLMRILCGIALPLSIVTAIITLLFIVSALYLGFNKFLLQFDGAHEGSIEDIFSCFNRTAFSYMVASLLRKTLVAIGLIFFIIPGIFFLIRFQFYRLLIIDHNDGIISSLRNSYRLTQGRTLTLLIVTILITILNYISGVLMIVVVPFTLLIQIYLYRFLRDEKEQSLLS
ncbi:MAG: hypothetical protein M1114_01460 [Candidatus Dependentiae bacterium]|nr:hypothetical protein [Candidatus Dependentiae bacterium]